jgi:hypothetical protein
MFFSSSSITQKIEKRRKEAELELLTVQVRSSAPELELDASSAQILSQTEVAQHEDGVLGAYYLTQVVRNPAGEYFLLKTTDAKPYVKHLPQARAKLVLKAKYLEPSSK